jgi:hypothetical protein
MRVQIRIHNGVCFITIAFAGSVIIISLFFRDYPFISDTGSERVRGIFPEENFLQFKTLLHHRVVHRVTERKVNSP